MECTSKLKQCLTLVGGSSSIACLISLSKAIELSARSKLHSLHEMGAFCIMILNCSSPTYKDDVFDYSLVHEKAKRMMLRIFPNNQDRDKLQSKLNSCFVMCLIAATVHHDASNIMLLCLLYWWSVLLHQLVCTYLMQLPNQAGSWRRYPKMPMVPHGMQSICNAVNNHARVLLHYEPRALHYLLGEQVQ